MNDRYLFRAKRTDNGEWIKGNLVWSDDTDDDYKAIIIPTTDSNMFTKGGARGDLGFENWHRVDPSTICQCTGRTDEDKKLIFEHDIVSYLDTYSTENGYAESYCVGEVLWDDETLSFQVTERLSAESYEVLDGGDDIKVLGNRFDNPELLLEGKSLASEIIKTCY